MKRALMRRDPEQHNLGSSCTALARLVVTTNLTVLLGWWSYPHFGNTHHSTPKPFSAPWFWTDDAITV